MESLTLKKREISHTKSEHELIEIDYGRLVGIEKQKQKYDSLSEDLKQIESDAYKIYAKIKEMENEILGIKQILSKHNNRRTFSQIINNIYNISINIQF